MLILMCLIGKIQIDVLGRKLKLPTVEDLNKCIFTDSAIEEMQEKKKQRRLDSLPLVVG